MVEQNKVYPPAKEVARLQLEASASALEIEFSQVADIWTERLSKLTIFNGLLDTNTRWQDIVSQFVAKKDKLCSGLFEGDDPRGIVYSRVSAYISDNEMRQMLLRNIDAVTREETEQILKSSRENNHFIPDVDVLVVGTGLHGSIATVEMQAYNPRLKILSIDSLNKRGGKFRSYAIYENEEIPIFDINSHHNQPFGVNKNDAQPNAAAHLSAVSGEALPPQNLLGAVVAVNSYLSSISLQSTFVEKIDDSHQENQNIVIVNHRGERFTLNPRKILIAIGYPKTSIPIDNPTTETDKLLREAEESLRAYIYENNNRLPRVVRGEDFLLMVAVKKGEIITELVGKHLVVVGSGDTAQSILKLLSGYGRSDLNEGYVSQFGRPKIYWIVNDGENIRLRPQHEVLRREIGTNDSNMIHPIEGYAMGLEESIGNVQLVLNFIEDTPQGPSRRSGKIDADMVIYCTGSREQAIQAIEMKTSDMQYVLDKETDEVVAKGNGITYIIGPSADIPLTEEEIKANPIYKTLEGNANAMRRLGPKTRAVARNIVFELNNA